MALAGKSFAILDFPAKQKLQLSKQINALGGTVAYTVAPGVFAVLTTPDEYERRTMKIAAAEKHNILVLDAAFIDAVERDKGRGFVYEIQHALNVPVDQLPPRLLSNPIAHFRKSIPEVAAKLAAIAAAVFEAPDTPSVSSLGDAASSDDTSSAAGGTDADWGAQVEREAGAGTSAEPPIDPSLPAWKRRLLERQAEVKQRQERDKAAKLEADQARARARHEERQATLQETKEEGRRKKDEAEAAKRAAAAARKSKKKAEVFAKRTKMEIDRRAVRDGEEEARKAAIEGKRQAIIDAKIAQLTEIAKKIVERELHKDEFEAKQREYLAAKEMKQKARHSENQRKLFVGNVIVEDIVHASKKLTGERDEEKFNTLLTGRTEAILKVFKRFGKIDRILPFWEQKHAFIMYSTEDEARAAYTALKDYEKRKTYAEDTRKELQKEKQPQLFAHKPNYYVRWNYNKNKNSKWGGKAKKKGADDDDKDKTKEGGESGDKEAEGGDDKGDAKAEETEPIEPAAASDAPSSPKGGGGGGKKQAGAKSKSKAKAKAKAGGKKAAKPQPPKPEAGGAGVDSDKTELGERLFELVAPLAPAPLVGKVTGMLLQALSEAELSDLMADDAFLADKVEEALAVLSHAGDATATKSKSEAKPKPKAEAKAKKTPKLPPAATAADDDDWGSSAAAAPALTDISLDWAGAKANDRDPIEIVRVKAITHTQTEKGLLVGGHDAGQLKLLSGSEPFTEEFTFADSPEGLTCLSAAGDCSAIVAGYASGDVRLWRGTADAAPTTFSAGSSVRSLALAKDAFFATLDDRSLQAWSFDGALLSTADAPHAAERFNVLSTDRFVATYAANGTVHLWDTGSKLRIRATLTVPHTPVRAAQLSPDGSLLVLAAGTSAPLYDANEAKALFACDVGEPVVSVAFSPSRYWLLVGTAAGVRVVDLEIKAQVRAVRIAPADLRWAITHDTAVFVGRAGAAVHVYSVDEEKTGSAKRAASPPPAPAPRKAREDARAGSANSTVDLSTIPRAPSVRLVWTSSLVVMPPKSLWGPFVDIKKHHMNPRITRPPFPHITLLAPFTEYRAFPQAAALLRKHLEQIEPFQLEFNKFELFANGGSNTLYLDPVVTPRNALQTLYDVVSHVYPQCLEANTKNEGGFEPHIGVGYFKSKAEALTLQARYQKGWAPLVFTCQEVYMLSRVGEGPFVVRRVVPLGIAPKPPLFDEVPE